MSEDLTVDIPEPVIENVDKGKVVDRFFQNFESVFDDEEVSYEYGDLDFTVLAQESSDVEELVWTSMGNGGKHLFYFIGDNPSGSLEEEFSEYWSKLNMQGGQRNVKSFLSFLSENFDTVSKLDYGDVMQVPDPYSNKTGSYPVLNIGLHFGEGKGFRKNIGSSMNNTGIDSEKDMEELVSEELGSDIWSLSDQVFEKAYNEVVEEDMKNIVTGLGREDLESSGYSMQKEDEIPGNVSQAFEGRSAEYWQKSVGDYEAGGSGFSVIWYQPDEGLGVFDPSPGDYDEEMLLEEVRQELE